MAEREQGMGAETCCERAGDGVMLVPTGLGNKIKAPNVSIHIPQYR